MRGIWTALVVSVAVAVFAVAGYVILRQDAVPDSGQALGVTSLVASAATSPSESGSATTPATARQRAVVAFLGDDYTRGVGSSSDAQRFTTIVCAALDVEEANFGSAYSGYAHPDAAGDYASRVDQLVLAKPDVVVVSGGRNDVDSDLGTVASNARALFKRLHRLLPHAVLVAVAPWWGDSPPREPMARIAVLIRHAAQAVGGTYLALPDPLLGHPGYMADEADPNDKGYAVIAAALGPKLRPLLPRSAATTTGTAASASD